MKRTGLFRFVVPLLLLLLAGSAAAAPAPLQDWQLRSVPALAGDLAGVTYGNGLYVAVGKQKAVAVSPDGVNWSVRVTPYDPWNFADVAYGDGRFVAVGARGLTAASDNGMGWQVIRARNDYQLRSVAYCGRQFVAVGERGSILTIPDLLFTQVPQSPTEQNLLAIACSDSQMVAVGEGGSILTSSDGIKWEASSWGNDSTLRLASVTWGPAGFVAVGNTKTQRIVLRSKDGKKWTPVTVASQYSITAVNYGNGEYAAVGVGERGTPLVLVSADGETWVPTVTGALRNPAPAPAALTDVVCAAPGCVAVGDRSTVFHSPSTDWPSPPAPSSTALRSLAYGGGRYVGLTQSGRITTSLDLKRWQSPAVSVAAGTEFLGLAYHNGLFVAVGSGGTVLLSRDQGTSWNGQKSDTTATLRSVISAGGAAVAAGDGGTIITSSDGVNWTRYVLPTRSNLTAVTYLGGTFVATGSDGTLFTSQNGRTWAEQGSTATAAPENYIPDTAAPRVKRIAIRPALATTRESNLSSGLRYRFEAIGYDAAGKEVGPVRAVWSIVYGVNDPSTGRAPLATADSGGFFVGHGQGPVVLRAFYSGLFADAELQVVASDSAVNRVAPPLRPAEYDSIGVIVENWTSPHEVVVGKTYKVSALGSRQQGSSGRIGVYWSIQYRLPIADGPKATLDADGYLTVHEPGRLEIQANTGDDFYMHSLTAVKR